jgi:hypothetical protein
MAATAGEANAGQFSSSRPTCVTSSLPTLRDYAGVHRVDAVCTACNHWAQLDLTALVASGHGDVPLVHLPLRCAACGAAGHQVSVSGQPYGLGQGPGMPDRHQRPAIARHTRRASGSAARSASALTIATAALAMASRRTDAEGMSRSGLKPVATLLLVQTAPSGWRLARLDRVA